MFFLQYESKPRPGARSAPHATGGIINCWIERSTLEQAIEVARVWIEAEGWIVDRPQQAYVVDACTYTPGKDGRNYFEQALIDKEVFVFYVYPESGEDA